MPRFGEVVQAPQHAPRQRDVDAFDLVVEQGRVELDDADRPAGIAGRLRAASRLDGAGMAVPASSASSNVSPAEKQPGRSGVATPNAALSVPSSIKIG